jgi:hypothetical protein
MNKNSIEETQELLSAAAAGDFLQRLMPEKTAAQWAMFLQNNRKPGRQVTYRVPFERLGSMGAFYSPAELQRFAEWEKQRTLGAVKLSGRAAEALHAFGIGQAGGSTTGRQLDYSINPQIDPATQEPYLQLIVRDPLMVFRVSQAQAKGLQEELARWLDSCAGNTK